MGNNGKTPAKQRRILLCPSWIVQPAVELGVIVHTGDGEAEISFRQAHCHGGSGCRGRNGDEDNDMNLGVWEEGGLIDTLRLNFGQKLKVDVPATGAWARMSACSRLGEYCLA